MVLGLPACPTTSTACKGWKQTIRLIIFHHWSFEFNRILEFYHHAPVSLQPLSLYLWQYIFYSLTCTINFSKPDSVILQDKWCSDFSWLCRSGSGFEVCLSLVQNVPSYSSTGKLQVLPLLKFHPASKTWSIHVLISWKSSIMYPHLHMFLYRKHFICNSGLLSQNKLTGINSKINEILCYW